MHLPELEADVHVPIAAPPCRWQLRHRPPSPLWTCNDSFMVEHLLGKQVSAIFEMHVINSSIAAERNLLNLSNLWLALKTHPSDYACMTHPSDIQVTSMWLRSLRDTAESIVVKV